MSRRVVGCRCLVLVALMAALASPRARAGEDPRTITRFLQELKSHGLHDQRSITSRNSAPTSHYRRRSRSSSTTRKAAP